MTVDAFLLTVIALCSVAYIILMFMMESLRSHRMILKKYLDECDEAASRLDYAKELEIAEAADLFIRSRE